MIAVSAFISLCSNDIQKKFGISKGAVEVLRQVYFYQHGTLRKCIASKVTIAKHSKLSKRAVYYALKQLQRKGVIRKLRREIVVSTAFLRYYDELKLKYRRIVSWSGYTHIKIQYLWGRCGKSVESIYRKLFAYSDNCTSLDKKLHPNSRFNSSELNNNSRAGLSPGSIRQLVIKTINNLSADELKEMYLEKLHQRNTETQRRKYNHG